MRDSQSWIPVFSFPAQGKTTEDWKSLSHTHPSRDVRILLPYSENSVDNSTRQTRAGVLNALQKIKQSLLLRHERQEFLTRKWHSCAGNRVENATGQLYRFIHAR